MSDEKKIVVQRDGPYRVYGGIPLVRKTQIVSEQGEPLTWRRDETLPTGERYDLCRCGRSRNKPFCDESHLATPFDGTETADPRSTAERQMIYPGGTGIVVKTDGWLCTNSGFCGNRLATIRQLVEHSDDINLRSNAIAMVERCPSGSLTYAMAPDEPDIEPDLPQQIAVVTEITSDGPVDGPLWVTGDIPIERADGQPLETRNRVMLCGCGRSLSKPLCDGIHRLPES
jgi:CDGSH-type Zn-finger protein